MTPRIETPGIYPSITMPDYIEDPCAEPSITKGLLKTVIERSPLHAWHDHPRLGGAADSNSGRADLGTLAHAMLLGGDDRIVTVDAPDFKTKAARQARDEARAAGQVPVLAEQLEPVQDMAEVARSALHEMGITEIEEHSEQTLIWREDGIYCKSRPDWLAPDRRLVIDYKTATNADPTWWIRSALTAGGYDMQWAHGLRGLEVLCGHDERRQFLFLVQEIDAPYACSWITLGPEHAALAQAKWDYAMDVWSACFKSQRFHGYSSRIHYSEVLPWDQIAFQERRLAHSIKEV